MRHGNWIRVMAVIIGLAMLAAACGDDDEGDEGAVDDETTSTTAPNAEGDDGEAEEAPSESVPAEDLELTVAVASSGLPFLQIDVAEAEGMYEEQGLDVEFISVEGSAAATAAVESGQADVMVSLPEGVITARAAGSTLTMIGATVNQNLYRLYVSADVQSLEDLAGKSIAMLVEGNGTDIQARWLMDEHGPGADAATYVAVGGLPNRLAALQQGQANAAFLFPPFDVTAGRSGLEFVADMSDYVDGYPHEVFAAREQTIEDNPEALAAFMAAIVDASQWIVDNPEDAIDLAVEVTGGEPDVTAEAFEFTLPAYALDGAISEEGLQWTLDVMERYLQVGELPAIEVLYDPQFLPG